MATKETILKVIEKSLVLCTSPHETAKVFRDIKSDGVFDTASKLVQSTGDKKSMDFIKRDFLYAEAADHLEDAIENADQMTAIRLAVAIASIIDDSSLSGIEKWCKEVKWYRRYMEKYEDYLPEY
jgi:hypothetical protein